jgi:YHS domain-containing protein
MIMKKYLGIATIFAVGLVLAIGSANADKEAKKEGKKADAPKLTCPVSGKPVNPEATVDYKGGKVAFCCPNCPKAFAANTEKYAAKANQQLYASKQAKLVACPITGKKLNPETKITVAGTPVCFCCNGCKGKVTKAEGDAQLELVFGDKAFEKGFEVVKKEKKDKKD